METIQILGILVLLIGIFFSKLVFDDLSQKRINWIAVAKGSGAAFFTILLGILMILNKVEF